MAILDYPPGSGPLCDKRTKKLWIIGGGVTLTVIILLAIIIPLSISSKNSSHFVPGRTILDNVPLVDGHNSLPSNIYKVLFNRLGNFNFSVKLDTDAEPTKSASATTLPLLRTGKVGAQFWVAHSPCKITQYKDATERALEQIDVIKRLVVKYPKDLVLVTSAEGIWEAFRQQKIGSLIAVKGGHAIDSRLSVLRLYYELGVRYMSLADECDTPWMRAPTSATRAGEILSDFGTSVVREMNRLGMMIDLSQAPHDIVLSVLNITASPVIFSHTSSVSNTNIPFNIGDATLKLLKSNDGIVMVNFNHKYVLNSINKTANIQDVANHINHIRKMIGVDNIGIGADFDSEKTETVGMEDVSKYPELFDLLASPIQPDDVAWSQTDLGKLAGENFIRVFTVVEKMRDLLAEKEDLLDDSFIYKTELDAVNVIDLATCRSDINEIPAPPAPPTTTSEATTLQFTEPTQSLVVH